MIGLGWLAYVRTDYRDSANNESHFPSPLLALQKLQFTLVKVEECYHFSLFFGITTGL